MPAHNAQRYIHRCIEGLRAAGVATDAIHVVDDGSSDSTVAICRAAAVEPILAPDNGGAAAARNLGASAASGEILFFVDADVVVAPDAVRRVVGFLEDAPAYAAVFGCYDDAPEAPGRVSRIRNLLHRHVHIQHAGDASTFWTGCGAVRRAAFDAVGGFDPCQKMMEDIKFGMDLRRHGYRIRLLPELQGRHLKGWTLASMVRSDLFNRAVPWTRLIRSGAASDVPNTLNVDLASRVAVASVAVSLIGLAATIFAPLAGLAVALMALATLAACKADFLRVLLASDRPLDAVVAIPVLWVHYFCAGFGYALVRLGV